MIIAVINTSICDSIFIKVCNLVNWRSEHLSYKVLCIFLVSFSTVLLQAWNLCDWTNTAFVPPHTCRCLSVEGSVSCFNTVSCVSVNGDQPPSDPTVQPWRKRLLANEEITNVSCAHRICVKFCAVKKQKNSVKCEIFSVV